MNRLKYYSFEVVIEKEEKGKGYYAYSPNLPGCFSNGRTIEEARKNIREALQSHLETLTARSMKVDSGEKLVHIEEICIGIPQTWAQNSRP